MAAPILCSTCPPSEIYRHQDINGGFPYARTVRASVHCWFLLIPRVVPLFVSQKEIIAVCKNRSAVGHIINPTCFEVLFQCQSSLICRNAANNCAVFDEKLRFYYQICIQKVLSSTQTAANNRKIKKTHHRGSGNDSRNVECIKRTH